MAPRPRSRSATRVTLMLVVVATLFSPAMAGAGTGTSVARETPPAFEPFDEAMRAFMDARGIHAGTFALSRQGTLLWSQGYGTMTRGGVEPVPPDAMLRLASVSKPMAAAAVRQLAATGEASPSDRVFCVPGQAIPLLAKCHLAVPEASLATLDPRVGNITLQHLLDHRGGWDRTVSGDPMFRAIRIAEEMGVASPPDQATIVAWVLQRPLDFAPGARSAYSNFGYMLLGLVVEQASGLDYVEYLRTRVFVDSLEGVVPGHEVPRDIILGHSLPSHRDPREPAYNCDGGWKARNVYAPSQHVCWADGGWDLGSIGAAGGLVASAETVAWFLDHYWIDGVPRHSGTAAPAARLESGSWSFYGSLDGTFTLARQHPSGYNYVALFNQRWDASGASYHQIRDQLDAAMARYHASQHGGVLGADLP